MSLRLILVCHAATAAVRQAAFPADEPLEPRGLAKAMALSGHLGRIDAAWTGPALRARQTAAALGLEPVVDPRLEDIDLGGWAGRSLAELEAEDPDGLARWTTDPQAAPHGGESVSALMQRARVWLDGRQGRDGRVAAVTHAAFIRAAVLVVLGGEGQAFWRIDVAPLCAASLLGRGGHWVLRSLGPVGLRTTPGPGRLQTEPGDDP